MQSEIPLIPVSVIIETVKDFFDIEFSLKLDIKDLEDKCKMILKRFNSDKYKENYDWYDHLKAIEIQQF